MLVMFNLSAAFDYVDQEQLMVLFECAYGIQGRALSWLKSYLDGRTYRFHIDGASSECVPLWLMTIYGASSHMHKRNTKAGAAALAEVK